MTFYATLEYLDFMYITDRLAQFYISNEDPEDLLESTQFHIQLEQYLCVCYGGGEAELGKCRKLEFFRFIGVPETSQGYLIQQFKVPDQIEVNDPIELIPLPPTPIHDCHFLRHHIFNYTDKTSLFRSTLFYVPTIRRLFRIQVVLPFLSLPIIPSGLGNEPTFLSLLYFPRKFLVPLTKKKQILKRLEEKKRLCEMAIFIHGPVERKISGEHPK
jgi:hypothetical protein